MSNNHIILLAILLQVDLCRSCFISYSLITRKSGGAKQIGVNIMSNAFLKLLPFHIHSAGLYLERLETGEM
jgi:hypothetical protein